MLAMLLSEPPVVTILSVPFAAIVLGHFSVWRSRQYGDFGARRLARAGLSLGYCGIVMVLLFVHVGRREPDAASAVASMRQLSHNLAGYADKNPDHGFPEKLLDLASPSAAQETPEYGIDPALASGNKMGYRFTYLPRRSVGGGRLDSYELFADPLELTGPGTYHFFVDETHVIRRQEGGKADARSDPM